MQLDLGSLIQNAGDVSNQLSSAADSVTAGMQQVSNIQGQIADSDNDAAQAQKVKTTIELNDVARQEANRKAIAARLGTDSSQAGWIIGNAADTMAQADQGLAASAEQIRQKQSVSLFDNPLGWIAAKLTVGKDIANYNYFATTRNNAENQAQEAERMTQESMKTNNALTSTATDSYINASTIVAANQYKTAALSAAAAGARANTEGILYASNLRRDQLSTMFQANTAQMQEKQYQTELQRLNLSQQEFNLRKQAMAEKTDEDSLIAKYVRSGYFNMTGKQLDDMSTKNAVLLFKSKQPDVMNYFNSGMASTAITGGDGNKPVISLSPYISSTIYGQGKVTNLTPAMQQVGDQLVSWRREFENPAVQAQFPYDPKDHQSKEVAFNKFVADRRQAELGSVPNGSIFAPAPLEQVANVNKNLTSLPVWKNVLEPASKTGVNINDPNTAFGIITSALKNGKLSYADAVDSSTLYAGALEQTNQSRNFIAFGMSRVGSYNAGVSVPGTLGKTRINLVDRNSLSTALNKVLANQALSEPASTSADFVQ